MQELTQLITAAAALAAVTVAPILTSMFNRRELRAEATARSRQVWIDTLRDELSQYLGELALLVNESNNSDSETDGVFVTKETRRNLSQLQAKIGLLLNHTEDDHRQLYSEVRSAFSSAELLGEALFHSADLEQIVATAAPILKREWDKTKNLTV